MKNPLINEIALKFPASSGLVESLTGVAPINIRISLYIATTNQQPMLVKCFINIKIDESKILPEYDLFYFLKDQAIGNSFGWSSQEFQQYLRIHQLSSALHSKIMKSTKLNVANLKTFSWIFNCACCFSTFITVCIDHIYYLCLGITFVCNLWMAMKIEEYILKNDDI